MNDEYTHIYCRTQQQHSKQQDLEDLDKGGVGDHTHKEDMSMSPIQAVSSEMSTERQERDNVGKEGSN